jgi:cysteine desulfuration protein SufE
MVPSVQLPPALAQIVQRFQRVTEPKRKYELLIALSQRLHPFPEDQKIPENKVPGCASQVYIIASLADGKLQFAGDSDSHLVKGLVALLIQGLNGLTPEELAQLSPDFIQATGLEVSLTPSRANGFHNIFSTMKLRALSYQN